MGSRDRTQVVRFGSKGPVNYQQIATSYCVRLSQVPLLYESFQGSTKPVTPEIVYLELIVSDDWEHGSRQAGMILEQKLKTHVLRHNHEAE